MYYELSKSEKKIARVLIDRGVESDKIAALEQTEKILADWKEGKIDLVSAYQKVIQNGEEWDQKIARRYDRLGGSRWLAVIAAIYVDGQITEDDIAGFSEKTKQVFYTIVSLLQM